VIGKVAKVAVPLTAQAISQASSSHTQAAQAHGAVAQAHAQLAQAHAQAAQTAPTQTAPQGRGGRQKHDVDPKTRLNLALTHLAKQYKMPPPPQLSRGGAQAQAAPGDDGKAALGDVASFIDKLKPDATQTSGYYVGDLASLFGGDSGGSGDGIVDDLTASLRRGFSSHVARPQPRMQQRSYAPPHVTHTPAPYLPPATHRTYTVPTPHTRRAPPVQMMPQFPYGANQGAYSDYGQQGYGYGQPDYAQQYAQQQGYDYRGPGTYPPIAPAVTYRPAAMPPLTPRTTKTEQTATRSAQQRQQVEQQATPLAKLGTFVKKTMGGPAYGGTGRGTGVPDEDLRNYQKGINKLYGYKALDEDGLIGGDTSHTREMTRAFQKWAQMPVTGNPDAATRDMLIRKLEEQRISRETPSGDWRTPSGGGSAETEIDWGTVGTFAKKVAEMGVLPPPMRAATAAKEEIERRKAEERARQLEGTQAPEEHWWSSL